MRLATSYDDFRADVAALAQALRPFDLPRLTVTDLAGFLALCETEPCSSLQALADVCVAWSDRHRQPPTTTELQQRRGDGLPSDADALLLRWGYPGVFGRWSFHMTLTDRLAKGLHAAWRSRAERHFATALTQPRKVVSICLFTQTMPGAPFLLSERVPLG